MHVDLRSDTVTRPDAAMMQAMAQAKLGDDVYGEDPSVNALEAHAAQQHGFEAALFASSGTQTNLLALLTHCQRGDEYIVGHDAHTYKYEGGGAAVLGSIQPQTIAFDEQARLPIEAVEAVIKPDDAHFARTRLLALENTQHGRVVPLDYFSDARALCQRHGLSLHLDGARAYNASVAQGVPITAITQHFDSVSICLSKGLGAPVGSLLLGSKAFIHQARRWRKMLGGGMRQAGVLAAAARLALDDGPARLGDDHRRAQTLAAALSPLVPMRDAWQQSNMVWLEIDATRGAALQAHCREQGVVLSDASRGAMRLVLHRDIDDDGLQHTIDTFTRFFA